MTVFENTKTVHTIFFVLRL